MRDTVSSEFLAAAMMADAKRQKAALRILKGDTPICGDPDHPLLLRPNAAVRLLGVSKATFWRLVQRGLLKPVNLTTKAHFFRRADVEALAGGAS